MLSSGTGLTKLGFAGNDSPSFIFPTVIATRQSSGGRGQGTSGGNLSQKRGTEDLDFFIGNEALEAANGPRMYSYCLLLGILVLSLILTIIHQRLWTQLSH